MFQASGKRRFLFRIVAFITLVCFIAYDVAWAYPADRHSSANTLAQETLFTLSDKTESFARVEAEYIAVSIRERFKSEPLAGVEDVFRYLSGVGSRFGIDVKELEDGDVKGQFFAYISPDFIFRFFNPKMRNLALPADDLVISGEYPINDYLSFQLLKTKLPVSADDEARIEQIVETVSRHYASGMFDPVIRAVLTFWPDRDFTSEEKSAVKALLPLESQKKYFEQAIGLIYRKDLRDGKLYLGKLAGFLAGVREIEEEQHEDHFDDGDGEFSETGMDEMPRRAGERSTIEAKVVRQVLERLPSDLHWVSSLFYGYWPGYFKAFSAPGLTHRDALALLKKGKETFFGLLPEDARLSLVRDYQYLVEQIAGPLRGTDTEDLIFINFIAGLWQDILHTGEDKRERQEALVTGLYYDLRTPLDGVIKLTREKKNDVISILRRIGQVLYRSLSSETRAAMIRESIDQVCMVRFRSHVIICTEDRLDAIVNGVTGKIEEKMGRESNLVPKEQKRKLRRFNRLFWARRIDGVYIGSDGRIKLPRDFFEHFKGTESVILIADPGQKIIEVWPRQNISRRVDLSGGEVSAAGALRAIARGPREFRDLPFSKEQFRRRREGMGIEKLFPEIITGELDALITLGVLKCDTSRMPRRYTVAEVWKRAPPEQFRLMELMLEGLADPSDQRQLRDIKRIVDSFESAYGWGLMGSVATTEQFNVSRLKKLEKDIFSLYDGGYLEGPSRLIGLLREHATYDADMAEKMAQAYGYDEKRATLYRVIAAAHDLGKAKTGKNLTLHYSAKNLAQMTNDEKKRIRDHTRDSLMVLKENGIRLPPEAILTIAINHEPELREILRRVNRQLGTEMDLFSVADMFCALTERRLYPRTIVIHNEADVKGWLKIIKFRGFIGEDTLKKIQPLLVETVAGRRDLALDELDDKAQRDVYSRIFAELSAWRIPAHVFPRALSYSWEEERTADFYVGLQRFIKQGLPGELDGKARSIMGRFILAVIISTLKGRYPKIMFPRAIQSLSELLILDPTGAEGMDLAKKHAGQFNRSVGQKRIAEDILKLLKEMKKEVRRRGVVDLAGLDESIRKAEVLLRGSGKKLHSFLLPFVFGMVSWMARMMVILTFCFFLLVAPTTVTAGTGKYSPITSTMVSEETIDATLLTRTYDDGIVASYYLDGPDEYINTRHDPDGTVWTFAYDASWNLTEFIVHYPDGSVEKVDPVQEIIEEWTPGWTFARGANYWEKYGYDIGDGVNGEPHEGLSTKKSALYQELNRWKGGYVRVFLFCDLRSGVVFDGGGTPVSFSANVYEDMDALIDAANALGIKLIPTLFDYTLADTVDMEGANPVGEYPELITDPVKRAALINLMAQFVNQYSLRREITEWDIINEPIEVVWAGTATLAEVQSFVADLADMIHIEDPGSVVTVGAQNKDTVLNWNALGLDKYGIHYYDYMGALQPPSGLDGPFSFTELEPTSVSAKMDSVYSTGAEGALFWQDDTGFTITDIQADTIQHWNMSAEVKPFAPEIVDVTASNGDRTFTVNWVPYTGALQGSVDGYTIQIGSETFFVPGAGTSSYAVDLPDYMNSGDYTLSIRTEMPDGQKDSDYSESVTISAGWSPYEWYLFKKAKDKKRGCSLAVGSEADFDIGDLVPLVLFLTMLLIFKRMVRSREEEPEAEPVPLVFRKPRGSVLEGFRTLLEEKSLREGAFTRKDFQNKRKKGEEKTFSYDTVASELEGMVRLGILDVDREKKPFVYELAEKYSRGPPRMSKGVEFILERLPDRPNYEQLDRARTLLDIETEKDVLFYYLQRIPEINLELIRLSSERARLSVRNIFKTSDEEKEEKLRICLERLEALKEELYDEAERLEDPSYPLSVTGRHNYREEVKDKIYRAIELMDIKNESAACASLCAVSRLLAEELVLISSAQRKRRKGPRVWFDTKKRIYKVLKGQYAKHTISGGRTTFVRETAERVSRLTWQAIRSCDKEIESIFKELDKVRALAPAVRTFVSALQERKMKLNLQGKKSTDFKITEEEKKNIEKTLSDLEEFLKGAKVREKTTALKATGFVRELLEIGEYASALEILSVIASLLETRRRVLENQVDRISSGRLSELRYKVHHRNSFNMWKTDKILEFLQRGKNEAARGWIYGMIQDRELKEPEFYRVNNLLQTARNEFEKWHKGEKWQKDIVKSYISAVQKRISLVELLNSFMESLRDQYMDMRLKGEPAQCMDKLFVDNFNQYLEFARRNNIGRGSPRLLWALFYYAASDISMTEKDPKKPSKDRPNPLFRAFQDLSRALEVDSIQSLAETFKRWNKKYSHFYEVLQAYSDSGLKSLESLDREKYTELLKSLSQDYGLTEEQERELLKAAAISPETRNLVDISRLEVYWRQMWEDYVENVHRMEETREKYINLRNIERVKSLFELACHPERWPGEFEEHWEETFVEEISSLSADELAKKFLKYYQEDSWRYKDLRKIRAIDSGEVRLRDIHNNLLGPLLIGSSAESMREAKEGIWILREWIYRHWDDTPKERSYDIAMRSAEKDAGKERSSRPPRMIKKGKKDLWDVFTKKLVGAGLCTEEEAQEIIRFGIFRIIKGETPRVLKQPRQIMEIYRQALSEMLDRSISQSEIETYGYFHEKLHELMTDDHAKALLERLKGRLGQEKFTRLMMLYQNQHGEYGTEEEFAEELAADYYSEKVIGNPVRLYDSEKKERISLNKFDRKVYTDIEESLNDIADEIGKQWARCLDNLVIYKFNEWAKTVPDETRSMRMVREHLMELLSVNKEKYDVIPFTPARFDHIFRRTVGGILAADKKQEKDFLFLFMLTLQFPFRDAVNYLERAYPSEYKHFIRYAHTRGADEKDGKMCPEKVMLFMEAHKRTVPEQIISDISHLFRNSVVSIEGLIRSNVKHLVRHHKDDISREAHAEFGQNSAGHIAEARYSISKMEGNMARLTVEDVRGFLREMNDIKNALAKDIEVLDGMISKINIPEDQKDPYCEANKRAKDDLHSLDTMMTILREEMDFEGDAVTLEHVSGILRQLVASQRLSKAFVYPRISWLGGLDPISGARIDCETNSRSEVALRVYLGEVEEFYPVPEKTKDDFEKNSNFAEKCLEARLKVNIFDENGKFAGTEYVPMDYKRVGGLRHHDYVFGGVFEPRRPGKYMVTAEARVTGYRYKDAKGRVRYGKFSEEESLWRPSINPNRAGDNLFGDIVFTVRGTENQTRMMPAFAFAGIGALGIWNILVAVGVAAGILLIGHFLKAPSEEQPAEEPQGFPDADMKKLKEEFIKPFVSKKEIIWDYKGQQVTATVEYDDIFKVFVVEPEISYRNSHPELDVLDMPAAQTFIAPGGSFGQIEAEFKIISGKPAILFNEVHPSRGYRNLKPNHIRDIYRPWAENATKEMISAARKAGIESFYASGKDRIRQRYKKQGIRIPEVNLWENYEFPFKGKGWKLIRVDLADEKQAELWELEQIEHDFAEYPEIDKTGRLAAEVPIGGGLDAKQLEEFARIATPKGLIKYLTSTGLFYQVGVIREALKDNPQKLAEFEKLLARQDVGGLTREIGSEQKEPIRGPFQTGDTRYYVEEISDPAEMEKTLDAWFASGEKRYFGRHNWESVMSGKVRSPGFFAKLQSEKGEILGIAYYHKGPFMFPVEGTEELCTRDVYIADYMEIAEEYRERGLGKVLIAKAIETRLNDPDIEDGTEEILVGHPAEDSEYAEKGKQAKDFFEKLGFRNIYYPSIEGQAEYEQEKYNFVAIYGYMAKKLLNKVRMSIGEKAPVYEQMTLFPMPEVESEPKPQPIFQQGILFPVESAGDTPALSDAKIAVIEIHPEKPGETVAKIENILGQVDYRCIVTRPSDAYPPDSEQLAAKYGIKEVEINRGVIEQAKWMDNVLGNGSIVFVVTGGAWGACHRHGFDSIITLIDSEKRLQNKTVRADFYFPLKYIYRFDENDDYGLFPERRLKPGELEHLEIYTSYLKACGIPYSAYLYGKELDSNCDYQDPQVRIFITDELPARPSITTRPPGAETPKDLFPPMGGGLDVEQLKAFAREATPEKLVEYLTRTGLFSQADIIRDALRQDSRKLVEFEKLLARQWAKFAGALEPSGIEVSPLFPVVDRKPDLFVIPVMGNLFAEGDSPTLAGRVIRYMYDSLVERKEKDKPSRERALKVLEEGRAVRQGFEKILSEKFDLEVHLKHKEGESDYHYDGETRAAADFILFYNKSTKQYRDPAAEEIRAYVTLKPDKVIEVHEHFIDLTQELIKKKIDFSAKATSPNGVYERLDNIIFYIASYHQKKAARIIRKYLKRHDIAEGVLPATDADPKVKGLSWAREPSKEESQIWQKISGSSKRVSYNMIVAAYAVSDYLEKLALRQDELGDADAAREFRAEAQRVRAIMAGKEAVQPEMLPLGAPPRPEVRIDDDLAWAGLKEAIWPLGERRLKMTLKRALSEILEDVKQQVSPTSKKFIITNIRYVESGDFKDVFRIEAEVDDGRRIKFGCRLIDEEKYEDIMSAQEKVKHEIDWFKRLRALNGVAIFIKKSYYIEDDFSRQLSKDLDRQDIYGLTIGEFVDGVSIDKIDDPAEKEKAYREAIETIIRAWLLTAEEDKSGETVGFYIMDMKGQNFVLQYSDVHLSPVVYVDLGLGKKDSIVWVIGRIRSMLEEELGIAFASAEEIDFLRIIPRTIDEFLVREADIDGGERELILDVFREIEESISRMEKDRGDTGLLKDMEMESEIAIVRKELRERLGMEDTDADKAELEFTETGDTAEELLQELENDPHLKPLIDHLLIDISEERHDEEKYDYIKSGYFSDIFLDASDPEIFYKVSRMDEGARITQYNNGVNIKDAQVLAELNKLGIREGIPQLIAVGATPNGSFWMKLKGIEGGEDLESDYWQELEPIKKIDVFIRVAEILHRMHETGWTHNDVAPDNILVNESGEVLLIDFGLARPEGEHVGGGHDQFSTGDEYASPQRDIYGLGRTIEHLFIEDKARDADISGHDIVVSGLELLIMGMTVKDIDRRTPGNMKDVIEELEKVRSYFRARFAASSDISRTEPVDEIDISPEERIMRKMEVILPEMVNGLITAGHRKEKIVLAVDEELAGKGTREQLGRLVKALKDRAGGNDQLAYFLKDIVIRYDKGRNLAAGLESIVQNGDGSVQKENIIIITSSKNREEYFKGFEGSSTITEIAEDGLTEEHYYPLVEVMLFTLFRALARMGEYSGKEWERFWREKFISCYRAMDNAMDLDEDAIWELCWDKTAQCYRTTALIRLIPGAGKVPDRGVYKEIERLITSAA